MKIVTEEPENRDNGAPVLRAPLCDHLHDPVTEVARRRVAYRLGRANAASEGNIGRIWFCCTRGSP